MQLTYKQFLERFAQRSIVVKSLARTALMDMLPAGTFLTDDGNVIHGKALKAILPIERHPGSMSVHLFYS